MGHHKEKRQKLISSLFPAGIPRLWCPLLTHYRKDGNIDFDRMSAHLAHIVPFVKGYLIPGSTGDGWELDDRESRQVTEFALKQAKSHGVSLLLGALKGGRDAMKQTMTDMFKRIMPRGCTDEQEMIQMLQASHVSGFTICPPRGKSLSQADIEADLAEIFALGMPTALYQLPQMTENEVSPETFGRLTEQYHNLVFFKDSSGQDRIAASEVDKRGVFLVRGAEGDYARWLKEAGGPYAGFLLSTANCFPRELQTLIDALEKGDREKASEISERLTKAIGEIFALVQPLPCGNPFTNANKSIDHFFAFGPSANDREGPMLHAKVPIPGDIIAATGTVLEHCRLMPGHGYMT